MFDENMPLREVCNKIIHATRVRPDFTIGETPHRDDEYAYLAWIEEREHSADFAEPEPNPIKWQYLSGIVHLAGERNGEPWAHLLEVPSFVHAIDDLLGD